MEACIHVYFRGSALQRLRLGSGLILFAFAAAHFINHATGLFSLAMMHEVQAWRLVVTRSTLGTGVLLLAVLTHVGLGLYRIARRGTLRMPWWEMLQIVLALAIPFLLLPHIVETRIANWAYGVQTSYLSELYGLWPSRAVTQILLLLLVWSHGCIGLHYWLRTAAGYRRIAPVLLILAIGVPALAIGGFVVAGQQTAEIMSEPEALTRLTEQARWPSAAQIQTLIGVQNGLVWGFAGLLGLVAVVFAYRTMPGATGRLHRRQSGAARGPALISFHDGPTVVAAPGMTLLEIARSHGIAQGSVCGGRARCGTCRVRIEQGIESLPDPGRAEQATLRSVDATGPVRLACQTRPTASLSVEVLVRRESSAFDPIEFFELKDVVAAHIRAIEAGEIVDVAAGETEALRSWADGELGTLISASAAPGSHFDFLGVRADYLRDRAVSAIAYRRLDKIVSLFVLPARQDDAVAVSGSRSGYHVLGWSDDHYGFYAVSELAHSELERLQEWLQERSTGRSDAVVRQFVQSHPAGTRAAAGSSDGAPVAAEWSRP